MVSEIVTFIFNNNLCNWSDEFDAKYSSTRFSKWRYNKATIDRRKSSDIGNN